MSGLSGLGLLGQLGHCPSGSVIRQSPINWVSPITGQSIMGQSVNWVPGSVWAGPSSLSLGWLGPSLRPSVWVIGPIITVIGLSGWAQLGSSGCHCPSVWVRLGLGWPLAHCLSLGQFNWAQFTPLSVRVNTVTGRSLGSITIIVNNWVNWAFNNNNHQLTNWPITNWASIIQ